MASMTSNEVTSMPIELLSWGGMEEYGWRGGGCLSLKRSKVMEFVGAKDSSELASLTAPLKSPSSNLAAIRAARFFKGSLVT